MKRYVRIDPNNRVVEIFENNTNWTMAELFVDSGVWIECPYETVVEHWRYDDATGKFIEPAPSEPEQPPIPFSVTKRQACLALLQMDLYDDVVNLIQAAGKAAAVEWETTSIIQRDNALVAQVAAALAWTDEFVDELFITAGGIA